MASRHMMSYVLRMLTRCRTEGVRKHARRVLLLLLHAAGLITYMQMMTHTLAIPPAPLLLQSSTSTCDVSAAQLLRFRECCWCCCCCHHEIIKVLDEPCLGLEFELSAYFLGRGVSRGIACVLC